MGGADADAAEAEADALLRRHSVAELRFILERLRADAERKKHDLRTMVGERYRDVIGAADAIRNMSEAAAKVGQLFEETSKLCDVANLKARMQASTLDGKNETDEERKRLLFPIAAQIRLLVITPEQIWMALENQDFLSASRLYLIARLVVHSLQTGKDAHVTRSSFPVVQRQWDALSPFRAKISERAIESIRGLSHNDQALCRTFGAIAILDSMSPTMILQTFLEQRAKAVENIFSRPNASPGDSKSADRSSSTNEPRVGVSPTDTILETVRILHSTLSTIQSLFFVHPSASISRIHEFLTSIQGSRSQQSHPAAAKPTPSRPSANLVVKDIIPGIPTSISGATDPAIIDAEQLVSSLYSEKTNIHIIFRHLPQQVRCFAPVVNFGPDTTVLQNSQVQSLARAWLSKVTDLLHNNVCSVLGNVARGRELADIRAAVAFFISSVEFEPVDEQQVILLGSHKHRAEWKSILDNVLSGESFSMWTNAYRRPFLEAAQKLVSASFSQLSIQPQTLLTESILRLSKGDKAESDYSGFIWESADVSVEKVGTQDHTLALCRTQTPSVSDINVAFQSAAIAARDEVLPLIGDLVTPSRQPAAFQLQASTHGQIRVKIPDLGAFDFREDSEALSVALQTSFMAALGQYCDHMSACLAQILNGVDDDASASSMVHIDQATFVGRVARAIAIKIGKLHPVFGLKMDSARPGALATASTLAAKPASLVLTQELHLDYTEKGSLPKGQPGSLPGTQTVSHIQMVFMDLYMRAHVHWIKSVGKHLEVRIEAGLQHQDWSSGEVLHALWENLPIQAQGDAGETMESKISLPVHASSLVVNALFDVCGKVNRVAAYTLEKPCLRHLSLELMQSVTKIYMRFVKSHIESGHVSQMSLLQILFDFQLLIKIFGVHSILGTGTTGLSDKDAEVESDKAAEGVVAAIKQSIDPIDLAIVDMNISLNVERFYLRTSMLFGALVLLHPRAQDAKRNPSLQEQHNLVSVAPPSPRFALLPLSSNSFYNIGMHTQQSMAYRSSTVQSESRSIGGMTGIPSAQTVPGQAHAGSSGRPQRTRIKPAVDIRLVKASSSPSAALESTDRASILTGVLGGSLGATSHASSPSGGMGSSGERVAGLVSAVAGNIMTASGLFSGVWGGSSTLSAAPSTPNLSTSSKRKGTK